MKATTYRGVRWYNSAPAVAGITSGKISRTGTDSFTKSDGRAVFNVSVAAEAENTNRTLTINQGTLKYGSDLMSKVITAGASIISVYALTEQTGSRGTINNHDYFQWGAYPGYCGNATDTDKGLLVYNSFSNLTIPTYSQTPFSIKSGKQFNAATSPFWRIGIHQIRRCRQIIPAESRPQR